MKWPLRIIIGLVGVLVVVGIAGALMINGVTRSAIESKASRALDVPATLGKANVKVLGGRLELRDLDIANPPGFDETPRFLKLSQGRVDVSFLDLLRERVEIDRVTLEGIKVNLEHQGLKSNHGTILKNLKAFQEQDQEEADPKAGKKLVIREIVLRDITVNVSVFPVGGKATRMDLKIPEIVLEDVGTGDDALSTADVVGVVTTSLLAAILHQGGDVLPDKVLKGLGKGLAPLNDLGQFGMTVAGEVFTEVGDLVRSVVGRLESIGDIFRSKSEEND